jgi:SAM-dependent methyltransferase
MGTPPPLDAEYFDAWYANMVGSSLMDDIQQRLLGLPPHLLSTSLLAWDGIAEVADALRVSSSDTLLDLACGRGGYGLEVASRTGARLVGVDFSAEAVRQARECAARLNRTADFRVGDLAATGLEPGSVDAVMCIDAIQFAEDAAAAYRELLRVVRPGGRAVLTCWEARQQGDERLPPRMRRTRVAADLLAAGFDDVQMAEKPDWQVAERGLWTEAAALDPDDDPALQSLHSEGVRVLETIDLVRRIMVSAVAPLAQQ